MPGSKYACNRGGDFLGLWWAAADRIAQAATGKRQGAGPRHAPASRRSITRSCRWTPSGQAPLVLGNEGAGVIEDAGDSGLAVGSRVMFTGSYGVRENGAWQEWLLARPEDLAFVPDAIDDVVAASFQWPI